MAKSIKKTIITGLCALLSAVMALSFAMTVLAWYDFTQSRTNEFGGTVSKTGAVLHKIEKNRDGEIIPRPVKNAEFTLFRQNGDGSWTQIGGIYITDASGKITVPKLNPGEYKFVEANPGYGYEYDKDEANEDIKEYPFTITSGDAALVMVEAYNRRLNGSLEITKTVTGEDIPEEAFDKEFEFTVTFSDGGSYQCTIDNVQLTIASGDKIYLKHGQKAVFEDLPVGIYYEVYETREDGYIITSKGNTGTIDAKNASKAEFINTYGEPEPGKIKITVEKAVAGEIPESEKGREFGFWLKINEDGPVYFTLKAGEKKTFELNSGDTYFITEEDPFGWGYIQTSSVNGQGTACAPEISVTFKNTYIGTVWKTIKGEKTWDLKGENIKLPGNITIYLKDGDKIIDSAVVEPDENGKWHYVFTAPKYRADKTEIAYTVEEAPVPGFESMVKGHDILNTYIPQEKPTETTTVPPETTTAPSETTTAPPETTTAPPETTAAPPETTAAPPETTAAPPETATAPPETATAPPETATAPPETATAPHETTTEPDKTTEEPGEATTMPEETSKPDKPGKPDRPGTGDEINIWIWASVIVISLLGLRILILHKPRKGAIKDE